MPFVPRGFALLTTSTLAALALAPVSGASAATPRIGAPDGLKATPYNANLLIRILKAIFRFADKLEDVSDPTKAVEFFKESRRTSKVGELPSWYATVAAMPNVHRRAFLLTSICTGIRRSFHNYA